MKPFEILFRLFAPPRRARRAASVSRPRLEALEDRVVPATILWTGAAGDNLWGSSGNWNLGRLPGAGDDVVIDVAGDQTVVYGGGTTSIRSLVSRESLRMAGGKLTATDSLKVTGAGLDFAGGSFGSAVTLTNADLRLGSTGAATFIFVREQNTLTGNPLSGQSIIVRADPATPAEASAKLTASGALINSGLIRLDSGATAGGLASL